MKSIAISILGAIAVFGLSQAAAAHPLYPNSVVSNDHEFIRTDDDSVFACMTYRGTGRLEMPDKRGGDLFANGTHAFKAHYEDGTSVGIWAHADLGSQSAAHDISIPVAEAVGKLPTFMRSKLRHVVIHKGNETAFGESEGHFFVMYSDNIRTRIRNHDLEETVFHESVHATLDKRYARSQVWRNAQRSDGDFITKYAASRPDKEDLAESALFAWAMLNHPGRLPADIEAHAAETMPNRLAFFEKLFLSSLRFRYQRPVNACN